MMEISLWRVAGCVVLVAATGCILWLGKSDIKPEDSRYYYLKGADNITPKQAVSDGNKEVEGEAGHARLVGPEKVLPRESLMGSAYDPALRHAVFRDLRPFLRSTPQTVTSTQPPLFLTGVKNHCFAMDRRYVNVGNISLTTAVRLQYDIRCLPYVYLAGFSKCGTTDFHSNLVTHQLLFGMMRGKYSQHVWDSDYFSVKETHFWDNKHCKPNHTLDSFTCGFRAEAIVQATIKYGDQPHRPNKKDDYREMLYIESTPRQAWHHDSWNEEQVHYHQTEPVEFTPDRIHHTTPDARVVFLLRDPVTRTLSDYCYLTWSKPYHSPEDFHRKVVDAISWWHNCTQSREVGECAYGNAPPGLPFHTSPSCGLQNQLKHSPLCNDYSSWGCGNAINRFRISFYHIYLAEWLRAFPRERVLILRSEDMFADHMVALGRVFDFLGMPPFRDDIYESVVAKVKFKRKHISMLSETRALLEEFFAPFNRKLAHMLNQKSPFWEY